MKRVCSTILALCFALSLAAPAYAAEAPEDEPFPAPDEVEIFRQESGQDEAGAAQQEEAGPREEALGETGPREEAPETGKPALPEGQLPDDGAPVIDVTVPETGWFMFNPYGLPVDTAGGTTWEQIISEPLAITNNGDAAVTVLVDAVGRFSAPSGATLVSHAPREDAREKEILLYAEFKDGESPWSGGYHSEDNQLLITDHASEPKSVLTLDGGGEGCFQMFGSASIDPAEDWCEDDVAQVTFTFTFISEDVPDEEPKPEAPEEPEPEATEEPAPEATEQPEPEATEEPEPEATEEPEPEATEEPAPEATEQPEPEATEEPEPEATEEPEPEATEEPEPEATEEPEPEAPEESALILMPETAADLKPEAGPEASRTA